MKLVVSDDHMWLQFCITKYGEKNSSPLAMRQIDITDHETHQDKQILLFFFFGFIVASSSRNGGWWPLVYVSLDMNDDIFDLMSFVTLIEMECSYSVNDKLKTSAMYS